jgi:tRNA-splicing ligase RtcB
MPDVHLGMGATVGSVVATKQAIVPAAVGVDIGCGMMAVRTSLREMRGAIERAVPVGLASHKELPKPSEKAWYRGLKDRYFTIQTKHPAVATKNSAAYQIGTLGGGNHFIEVCLDEADRVWVMLHSGSRGVGNLIGSYFIERAQDDMRRFFINLPDADLAYLPEGTPNFADYMDAVEWAQSFAMENRQVMMRHAIEAMRKAIPKPFKAHLEAVNCHHNYVARESHFGEDILVTRKGAVRAAEGVMGIIPGSMGAKSFIVRGRGHADSFCSCSHGAGRVMSRTQAKLQFTVADHAAATAGVECRKDEGVIDETPRAYKDIDAVMAAQADLVEIVYTLRQVVCVKG